MRRTELPPTHADDWTEAPRIKDREPTPMERLQLLFPSIDVKEQLTGGD